jgi:hypothetical protein
MLLAIPSGTLLTALFNPAIPSSRSEARLGSQEDCGPVLPRAFSPFRFSSQMVR